MKTKEHFQNSRKKEIKSNESEEESECTRNILSQSIVINGYILR